MVLVNLRSRRLRTGASCPEARIPLTRRNRIGLRLPRRRSSDVRIFLNGKPPPRRSFFAGLGEAGRGGHTPFQRGRLAGNGGRWRATSGFSRVRPSMALRPAATSIAHIRLRARSTCRSYSLDPSPREADTNASHLKRRGPNGGDRHD